MERTGRCLCGAVRYTAKSLQPKMAACNCSMCRRWSGGPYLSIGTNEVEWSGEEALTTYTSSDWAERGFCSVCGSSLFYRVTKDGPFHGAMHIAFGTLDDQSGFDMKMEFYIDLKPSAYAFAGEHKRLTEAEVMALFTELDA
jgi:hypothetical protein